MFIHFNIVVVDISQIFKIKMLPEETLERITGIKIKHQK